MTQTTSNSSPNHTPEAETIAELPPLKSTELLTGISHEIRTPLTAILTLTDALKHGVYGEIPEQQLECLNTIANSGHDLLKLLGDVIELSKLECQRNTLDLAPLVATSMLDQCLNLVIETAHKKRVRIERDFDASVHSIQADVRRLKQVLVNVLLDAVKWTPPQGKLRVVLAGDHANETVSIQIQGIAQGLVERYQQSLLLGTTAATQMRFSAEAFLNLHVLRYLVESHGGTLSLKTVPIKDEAAWTVCLELPWHKDSQMPPPDLDSMESDQERVEALSVGQVPYDAPLILLAEDDPANLRAFSDVLMAKGYQVKAVFNGLEAVLQAQQVQPNLILMDIQMPELDGISAAQQLRKGKNTQDIPIVLFSAHVLEGQDKVFLDSVASAFLQKPVPLDTLFATLERLLPRQQAQTS